MFSRSRVAGYQDWDGVEILNAISAISFFMVHAPFVLFLSHTHSLSLLFSSSFFSSTVHFTKPAPRNHQERKEQRG
jgi:hypothetical protein